MTSPLTPAVVLIVEDNPADARLAMEHLREAGGFETVWAASLREARAHLEARPFTAILLDLMLPDASGLDLVRSLAALAGEAPVIVLSGLQEDDLAMAREAVGCGAQDFLPKSCLEPNLLQRSISTAIERTRLQAALAEREARLEAAQRLAQSGDWHWEPARRRLHLSRSLHDLLGLPVAPDGVGLGRVLRMVRADDRPRLLAALRDPACLGERLEIALRISHGSGVQRDILIDGRPERTAAGGLRGLFGIAQDITERRKVERIKDELVSMVSHELRTPLTAMCGALGLLEGGCGGDLPETAQRLLGIARANGDRLARLIDDLLDLERVENGGLTVTPEPVPLAPLFERLASLHAPLAQKAGSRIELACADANLACLADPGRLAQIIGNLLSNAFKFTPRGASVRLAASRADGFVRIAVRDEGPGIPLAFQPHLFDRFAQADSSSQRSREGSGLGLSIVKSLVERHGGRCSFKSVPGHGTTFFVDLPEAASLPEAAATRAVLEPA